MEKDDYTLVNKSNLSEIIYENENTRILIYDLVINKLAVFLFDFRKELTEAMALKMYLTMTSQGVGASWQQLMI